jgi:glycine cleavage system regulatory protein
MQTSLVITILGDDRPGLINVISDVLLEYKANWAESRMANLAGKFAGILDVSVSKENVDELLKSLKELSDADNNLHIYAEHIVARESKESGTLLNIELLSQDRPGIIDEITNELTRLKVNVEELLTEQRDASMGGGKLFYAKLMLRLPEGLDSYELQEALEALSDQLMVDINFHGGSD